MSLYRPFLIRSDIRTRYYQQLVISGARVVDEKGEIKLIRVISRDRSVNCESEGLPRYQTRGWILESVITEKGLRAKLLSRRGGVISDDACALPSQEFKYGPCGTLHPSLIFLPLSSLARVISTSSL